jgi:hypothetical protein
VVVIFCVLCDQLCGSNVPAVYGVCFDSSGVLYLTLCVICFPVWADPSVGELRITATEVSCGPLSAVR